jgi:hypothetical protein
LELIQSIDTSFHTNFGTVIFGAISMSKRKLVLQSAGGILGLVCLNLALAPSANASGGSGGNMSHGTGSNMSHGTGSCSGKGDCGNMSHGSGGNMSHGTGNMSHGSGACSGKGDCNYPHGNMSHGTGGNMSHGSGGNMSHGSGGNGSHGTGGECKTAKCDGPGETPGKNPGKDPGKNPGKDPDKDPGKIFTDRKYDAERNGSYTIGLGSGKLPGFNGGTGGQTSYNSSALGLSKQLISLLNAASNAYAEASARLAEIQSRTAPAAKKESVRYSRVADANADCGCNATAAAPDNSAELAAAKAAEAEAAASLAKAQEQARQFLEAQKQAGNNLVANQFSPIW